MIVDIEDLRLLYSDDFGNNVFTGTYLGKPALLEVRKSAITPETLRSSRDWKITFQNDKYSKFTALLDSDIQIKMIYPATKKDLEKPKKLRYIETYEMYKNVNTKSNVTWIENIFSGVSEKEKIAYEDEDFIMIPDFKWDIKDMKDLYYLVIVRDKELKSIRDLSGKHLELLEKIYHVGIKVIESKHGIEENELRIYVHYHPSVWWFHVHFNLLSKNWPGSSVDIAHTLLSVINNIKLIPNYYQKVDLEVVE